MTGGVPHVCGGNFVGQDYDSCYRYEASSDSWSVIENVMNEYRQYDMGWAYDAAWGLVLSGGRAEPSASTAEKTLDGVTFDALPDLPEPMGLHCLAIVDSQTLLVAGMCIMLEI